MLFGPITDKERLIWQRQAVKVLADIISEAVEAGMPFVRWEIGNARTLVATCLDHNMALRRAAFEAWVRFLGISNAMETAITGSHTRMHGSITDFRGCQVLVLADLYAADDIDVGRLP